jgi:hypothetical protein
MLKTAGTDGQLALGPKYAGHTFDITEREDGALVLVPADTAPESEAWPDAAEVRAQIGN